MNHLSSSHGRVLAIAPSTRGFGFAVLEHKQTLVDWGVKVVKGNKNAQCVKKADELILQYHPHVVVVQDYWSPDSRRFPRIRKLGKRLITLAQSHKIEMKVFSRSQICQMFFPDGQGTKYAVAELLAQKFPDELGPRLPRKRRPWMSEDSRMDVFEAVALALMTKVDVLQIPFTH